jgi:hypothetical protein
MITAEAHILREFAYNVSISLGGLLGTPIEVRTSTTSHADRASA